MHLISINPIRGGLLAAAAPGRMAGGALNRCALLHRRAGVIRRITPE